MFDLKNKEGIWLKGNLHAHSKISDGDLSYKKVIKLYHKNGYDFLAVTDHFKCSKNGKYKGMTILSGAEFDSSARVNGEVFHIVGIGLEKKLKLKKELGDAQAKAQGFIDKIHSIGGIAVLAHPLWSLETPEQIGALKDFDLSEIYNSTSDEPFCVSRGYSGTVLDSAAARFSLFPYLIAADDSHHYQGEECRGYIMLKARDNSPKEIKNALLRGDFYASKGGPEILNIAKIENGVKIEFSTAQNLYAFTDNPSLKQKYDVSETNEFAFDFNENPCKFVRFVIEDSEKNPSFSSYISIN